MAKVDKLLGLLQSENVASKLSKERRREIADKVIRGYTVDRRSRSQWEERCEDAIKLAKQITEPKNFPWEDSADVVIPLLTVASNVFAARTYAEIIETDRIVKVLPVGDDPQELKRDRAERVSAHMSYQRLVQSDTWEPDTDKLLHMLPIVGVCFRKVYYDAVSGIIESDLCSPQDIVVNHTVSGLDKAYRITHRYTLNKNEIIEKIRSNYFIDFDIEKSDKMVDTSLDWDTSLDSGEYSKEEDNVVLEFLEQHTYLDLDGDGYEEPWIVIVSKANNETVGIYPRFDPEEIKVGPKGQILKIKPTQYFIDYHFLPSPDGGYYSMGYGHILYPLCTAINTLTNQLIDAGTLSNTNCGLLSRTLKIKGGSLKMQMGEFKPVDPGTTGRIADSVHEFQFKPPSNVLFQLLGLLMDSAKQIASINEVMMGEAKPQNAPASSVMELASQGKRVFSAIAKRLYRSLKREFQLLYDLNGQFLEPQEYFNFHDNQLAVSRQDYSPVGLDIYPIASPEMDSETKRTMQANAITTLMQNPAIMGELKINNVVREFFRALDIPKDRVDTFVFTMEEKQAMSQQQQPDIEQQKLQLEMQKMEKDFQIKAAQNEKANRELELKYLDLQKKYALKEAETAEKQARMLADAHYKQAQADTMSKKLDIEQDKVDAMRQKARNER